MKKLLIPIAAITFFLMPISLLACGVQGNEYRTGTGMVSQKEAKQMTTKYISTIDSSLKVGKVEFNGETYDVKINNDQGELVAKLQIHKLTGEIRPIF